MQSMVFLVLQLFPWEAKLVSPEVRRISNIEYKAQLSVDSLLAWLQCWKERGYSYFTILILKYKLLWHWGELSFKFKGVSQTKQASSSLVEYLFLSNLCNVCFNIWVWGLYHWANLLWVFFSFFWKGNQVKFHFLVPWHDTELESD